MDQTLDCMNHDWISQSASHILIERAEVKRQLDRHQISKERQDDFFKILWCLTYDGWEV